MAVPGVCTRRTSVAVQGMFEIKTTGEAHKCMGVQNLGHRQASAEFISLKLQQKLRENPSYRPKVIQVDIRLTLGISIPYLKASRAKALALRAINGTDEESYASLPRYCDDLDRNNPGSKIVLESTPDGENRTTLPSCFYLPQCFCDGIHLLPTCSWS